MIKSYYRYHSVLNISRRTSNYPIGITLSHSTHMMSVIDPVVIGLKMPKIDNMYFLTKNFIKLISMNPQMILYQTIN